MRGTDSNGLESEVENKEALEDLTYNADLFLLLTRAEEVFNTLILSNTNTNYSKNYYF